jgi:hypothetical protein
VTALGMLLVGLGVVFVWSAIRDENPLTTIGGVFRG